MALIVFTSVVFGLPLIMLAGAVSACHVTRRTLAARPTAFRCKIRPAVSVTGQPVRWPRRVADAMWVHDSLLIMDGWCRARVRPLPIRFADGAIEAAPASSVRGLGPAPLLLSLRLDDGRDAILAAPRAARSLIAGPYLVAQLAHSGDHSGGQGATGKQTPGRP